jgi:hypothetical protein
MISSRWWPRQASLRRTSGLTPDGDQCELGTFSPASMRKGSTFWRGGRGQVAYGEKAHGGLYASLKSSVALVAPSLGTSASRKRPAP